MSKEELENWQRIKDHMEIGKTDNHFYLRAVAIVTKEDPIEPLE